MLTVHHFDFIENLSGTLGVLGKTFKKKDSSPFTIDFGFNCCRQGPNAPVDWVKDCILSLSPEKGKQRSKILLGLNFYGQDYGPNGGTRTYAPIKGLVYDVTAVAC